MSIDRNGGASESALRVHEFGKFQDNHGWVQCQSKTYPDRVYFYNTNSGCSTWYRPISRYVDIPSMKRRIISSDDITMDELELMSVSDNEASTRKRNANESLIKPSESIIAQYYAPWLGLISDDSCKTITRTCESRDRETDSMSDRSQEPRDYARGENNDSSDDSYTYNDDGNARAKIAPLSAVNLLQTDLYVGRGKVDLESATALPIFEPSKLGHDDAARASLTPSRRSCVVYGVPRLMQISLEHQIVKPVRKIRAVRKPRRVVSKPTTRKPRPDDGKIITYMYGVKTINYDPPDPDQIRPGVDVKTSRLTDTDSDDSEPRAKTTKRPFEFVDVGQNTLPTPLLSDSSSSPSSQSGTSNSATCSTCSTCSTCN